MLSPADQEASESSKRFQASAETYTVSVLPSLSEQVSDDVYFAPCNIVSINFALYFLPFLFYCSLSFSFTRYIILSIILFLLFPHLPFSTITATDSNRSKRCNGLFGASNGQRFCHPAYGLSIKPFGRPRCGNVTVTPQLHRYIHTYLSISRITHLPSNSVSFISKIVQ